MKLYHDDGLDSRFLEAWEKWAGRGTRLSPATAAGRIRSRLAGPERHFRCVYAAAATALICVSAGLTYIWLISQPPAPGPAAISQQITPLGEGEVLMWLDDQTPLYMNFQPPRGSRVQ
jgi:hypothetical protein